MSVLYRIFLRTVVSRARLIGLGALALLPVLLGLSLRAHGGAAAGRAAYSDLVEGYCLGLLAPVVTLVVASAALGDPAEDGTLVYLWCKPVRRWKMTAAALAASLTVAVPLVVVPTFLAAALAGSGGPAAALGGGPGRQDHLSVTFLNAKVHSLPLGAALATGVAVLVYATLFLGLGLRVRRALIWGLTYVLIWEGAVAHTAKGAARASVQVQARSLLAAVTGHAPPRNAVGTVTSLAVPAVVVVLALACTTRWLARSDVA